MNVKPDRIRFCDRLKQNLLATQYTFLLMATHLLLTIAFLSVAISQNVVKFRTKLCEKKIRKSFVVVYDKKFDFLQVLSILNRQLTKQKLLLIKSTNFNFSASLFLPPLLLSSLSPDP